MPVDIRSLAGAALAVVLAALPHADISAQPIELQPILSQEGVEAAIDVARANLADDARIVLVGAIGNSVYNSVELRFDPTTGTSTAWAYLFASASREEQRMYAVFDIQGMGRQASAVESPVELPKDLAGTVDLSLTYAASNRMMERLRADTTYIRYTGVHPGLLPQALAFRNTLDADLTVLPEDFPVDASLWNISYQADDGSTMLCFVAGGSGRTYCVTTSGVSAAPAEPERSTGTLVASPNPVSGLLRITAHPPGNDEAPLLQLYDATGRLVIDRIEGRRSDGAWIAEIDTTDLPHGAYHLKATQGTWNITTSVLR